MARVSRLTRHGGEIAILALLAVTVSELVYDTIPAHSKPVVAVAALLWTLALLSWRRNPLIAALSAFAVVIASSIAAPATARVGTVFFVILAAVWVVSANSDQRDSLIGVAGGVAAVSFLFWNQHEHGSAAGGLVVLAIVATVWLTGRTWYGHSRREVELERRTQQLEAERERLAEVAVAEERARIARELHDVIAHSISVMTIHATAARLLLDEDQPGRARDPLSHVESTGRDTLAEMRRLVAILRTDQPQETVDPQPGMAQLGELIDMIRGAGVPTELEIRGSADLPPGVDLACYRIVQEALTNVLKHAGPARASVTVYYSQDAVRIDVVNDSTAPPHAGNGEGGHGLVGMRERARLYGGHIDVGPRPEGGFAVRATLPRAARSSPAVVQS